MRCKHYHWCSWWCRAWWVVANYYLKLQWWATTNCRRTTKLQTIYLPCLQLFNLLLPELLISLPMWALWRWPQCQVLPKQGKHCSINPSRGLPYNRSFSNANYVIILTKLSLLSWFMTYAMVALLATVFLLNKQFCICISTARSNWWCS